MISMVMEGNLNEIIYFILLDNDMVLWGINGIAKVLKIRCVMNWSEVNFYYK